jgi:hypothetical protein
VLYIDASPLRSVISSTTYGTIDALKTSLAKNALIYLPLKAIYAADNYAYQTISGGFKAGNNIVSSLIRNRSSHLMTFRLMQPIMLITNAW